ncbi:MULTISPECIES: sugar ABC transporter ATP-binding protein [Streptomyces]|uniref:sugar ABC transporter ATP-binding protein n=1 Tax=Streptomyces TaxID=1883 RepID=UPI000F7A460B|nr:MULTISPECIES: sugar ABC transporter ATP-binding protein [Streptomyces]RST06889.1 sugar ABC transporter ATP-binding protein [Streptomyces sp. WAC07149]GLX17063.1 sugar ABC transporter ATP-binding protein [Streptomyces lavendulae subsp. lavendulae]GLX29570.1 sugar ABC transporter ATP-binding protein [Streptomyces lavendulae subsp. lavendulae]
MTHPSTPPPTDAGGPRPVLEAHGISKRFPGVLALDAVALRLFPGEVHALMGENGAGKSTLIKVLTGVHPADGGTVLVDGSPHVFTDPLQAQRAGISTVYQEVNLCPNLSVAENILIGREPRRFGLVRWSEVRRRAAELLTGLELDLDVTGPLDAHSLAVRQLVAIVRAVDVSAKVLVLDEPTSSLDREEVAQLFGLVRRLRDRGVAILFVTHFLDQVFDLCDRVTVLRGGRLEGEYPIAELTPVTLVQRMIGGEPATLDQLSGRTHRREAGRAADEPFLRARRLTRTGSIEPYDLDIHAGEVVGLAGLLGSGRTEAARLLFGADSADAGEVRIEGRRVLLRSPRHAIARGIAFCSENRKSEGLVGELTVRENIILALQAARGWTRPLTRAKQDELALHWIEALDIRPPDPEAQVRHLSGGNQQKVLLARWLLTEPRLLILDEPTRGIDIGAKAEIQKLVARLAGEGTAVLFVSAELEEVLRLSHRIAVLRDHRMVATLANDDSVTPERLLTTIATGTDS